MSLFNKNKPKPQDQGTQGSGDLQEKAPGTENSNQTEEKKNPLELDVSAVTSEVIRSSATVPGKDPRLVAVKISYPENYKGPRHFKDGEEKEMSPESAEAIIKKGIAKLIDDSE